jgi:hypothetical protein
MVTVQRSQPELVGLRPGGGKRSNTSGGWPPEIRWRSLMTIAGTERMPARCQ